MILPELLALPDHAFAGLLIFIRLGAVFFLLPVIGEFAVPPRLRLALALVVALLVTPSLSSSLPPIPASLAALAGLIAKEVTIGLFLGFISRLLLSACTVAGLLIANLTALSNALVNDPVIASQNAVLGSFLSLVTLILLLAFNVHHILILGIVDSYRVFPVQAPLEIADMSEELSRVFTRCLQMALRIAAPFLVGGLIFNLLTGLLARLVPTVQIFFIILPLQILLGFGLGLTAVPLALIWFARNYATQLPALTGGL